MRSSHSTAACAAVTKLTATGWSTFTSTVLAIGERAGVRAARIARTSSSPARPLRSTYHSEAISTAVAAATIASQRKGCAIRSCAVASRLSGSGGGPARLDVHAVFV